MRRTKPWSPEQIDQDIQREQEGRAAELALAALEPVADEVRRSVEKEIFRLIESEEGLAPQRAVQAWLTIYAQEKLARRLRDRKTRGVQASERIPRS